MKSVCFSIVTVCRNCKDTIAETIESVIGQDYKNMEYVLVDGGSTDGTLEIITEYAARDPRIRYVSERDNGIYDAMNKAAAMATGDFVQFINSGDRLYEKGTLSAVAAFISGNGSDIFFGDSLFCYGDGRTMMRRYPQACSWGIYYLLGDCINHQAIIASRKCFSDSTFDTSYRVGADRDWMIRMKKGGMKWKSMGIPVVRYLIDEDSFSVKNQEEFYEEVKRQTEAYFPKGSAAVGKMLESIRKGRITAGLLHFISNRTIFRQ